MQHSFDIDIACEYGVTEAILLNNLYFWIEKNRVNEVNYYDGYYWTYNSVKAFSELFPYLSGKQIRSALNKLIDKGLLITGNYNKSAYDRTLWYALTEKGLNVCRKEAFASDENDNSICPNGKMELQKRENQNAEKGKPIPYINTDNKTDINILAVKATTQKRFIPPTVEEVKAYCMERHNNIDAEYFIDYYEARNWELTKGRKVKNWKACIRTWEKNNYSKGKSKIEIDSNFRNFLAQNEVVDFGL